MSNTATNYHHRCGHPLLMDMDDNNKLGLEWFDRATLEDGNHRTPTCPRCGIFLPMTKEFLERAISRGDIAADKKQVVTHDHSHDGFEDLPGHEILNTHHTIMSFVCGWGYSTHLGKWVDPKREEAWWQDRVKAIKANLASTQHDLSEAQAQLDLFTTAAASQEVAE